VVADEADFFFTACPVDQAEVSTMSLRNRLFSLLHPGHDGLIEQLAAELTRRSRERVQNSVCQRAPRMSQDMARGYIRAHAVRCIAAEMNHLPTRSLGGGELRRKVADAAITQLIPAVLGDLAMVKVSPRVPVAA
jgi:hypothetical protein